MRIKAWFDGVVGNGDRPSRSTLLTKTSHKSNFSTLAQQSPSSHPTVTLSKNFKPPAGWYKKSVRGPRSKGSAHPSASRETSFRLFRGQMPSSTTATPVYFQNSSLVLKATERFFNFLPLKRRKPAKAGRGMGFRNFPKELPNQYPTHNTMRSV